MGRDESQGQGEYRRLPSLTHPIKALTSESQHPYVQAVLSRTHYPYEELSITKRAGGNRFLHSPEPDLMVIQRTLLDRALNQVATHPRAMAYRLHGSVVDCAAMHLNSHTVIRLDIADFFSSIRERHIFESFLRTDWTLASWTGRRLSRLAAYQLALLTTVSPPAISTWPNRGSGARWHGHVQVARRYLYVDQREGFLPQGAPTSGAVANIVMSPVDAELYRIASEMGLRYTRYSDDMHFSSRRPIDRHTVTRLVRQVREQLAKAGLRLNDSKIRVARPGSRRSVLGVLVDGSSPRLPRERHREIELHLRGIDRNGPEEHALQRGFATPDDLRQHVSGLIGWARHVEPTRGDEYRKHLERGLKRSAEVRPKTPNPDDQAAGQTAETVARESIDRLLADGHSYRKTAEYREFIDFLGRFRSYSPFNAAMVKLQRPGARYVATANAWDRDYRRVIRPGAQPLVIMQPRGPYMVVYDVGDTEALPGAPALPRDVIDPFAVTSVLSSDRAVELWDTTVDNAIRDGIRITLVDHAPSHAGAARWTRLHGTVISRPGPRASSRPESFPLVHEIEVNENLSPVDRYVTLVHELAHVYCGHIGSPDPRRWPDRRGSKQRAEIEAETIAYIVLRRLDPTAAMGDYLLGYLSSSDEMPDDLGLRLMIHVATLAMKMGAGRLPASGGHGLQ